MRAERIISSIPKDIDNLKQCPHMGNNNENNLNNTTDPITTNKNVSNQNWIYPSPKMFWEAMNRKGTLPSHLNDPNSPKTQEELDWIVTIHNVVNEQCWQEICKWEKFRSEGCKNNKFLFERKNHEDESESSISESPVLQRFLGRPDDLSPRAWFKSSILGYRRPFDRHDWYIRSSTQNDEAPRRYVIDFYTGKDEKGISSFHLDVRPALDTIDDINLRIKKYLCGKIKMQPIHQCSQDCETLHKEISKKIILILMSSRILSTSITSTSGNKELGNNWFGLETAMTGGELQRQLGSQEENVKSFLSSEPKTSHPKELKLSVYLNNQEGNIGVELEGAEKGSIRKGKILLEIWKLKFQPKNFELMTGEEEIRRLYKRTSLFIRSLHTITRLLPIYNIAKLQKLPLDIEITSNCDDNFDQLEESIISMSSESSMTSTIESVNKTELSLLQTNHGDLEVQVSFRKLHNINFYTVLRSPAIRVPQQVIKTKDIQIKSSPAQRDGLASGASGEWIEMTAASTGTKNSLKKMSSHGRSGSQQNIKILTTVHKPSSLMTSQTVKPSKTEISEFIKIFEKVPSIEFTGPQITASIQQIELGRSRKIHVDRWLEELEIEYEKQIGISEQFDLINNME